MLSLASIVAVYCMMILVTYSRKLQEKLEMNISNNRFKTKHILDKKTKYIIFYGHSLGKQDYAYFQSIFDFFDLYHENITLEFIYSYYPSKEDF